MAAKNKIEEFLEKHQDNPAGRRFKAIIIAYLKRGDNNTLADRLEGNDVHSGLASSMLQYRSQLDPKSRQTLRRRHYSTPWAGAYIDVEDNWGSQLLESYYPINHW